MAWTYLQLTNRVLRRFNEVQLTSSTFPTAIGFQQTVQDHVNDALNDIFDAEIRWPFFFETATVNTVAYTQNYSLASDAGTENVSPDWNSFFRNGNLVSSPPVVPQKLVYLDYNDWQSGRKAADQQIILATSQGAAPLWVFPYGNDNSQFGISPPPDTVYTIYYEYFGRPTDLALYSDTMVIPDQFSKVVIDGATYYAYMFRDNVEEAQVAQKKFTDGISEMRTRLINKADYMRSDQTNNGSSFVGTPGYF